MKAVWYFLVDRWIGWRVNRGVRTGAFDNPSTIYRKRQRMARMTGEDS